MQQQFAHQGRDLHHVAAGETLHPQQNALVDPEAAIPGFARHIPFMTATGGHPDGPLGRGQPVALLRAHDHAAVPGVGQLAPGMHMGLAPGIGWEVVIKPDYRPGGRIIGREIAFGFQWFHGRPAKANPNKKEPVAWPFGASPEQFHFEICRISKLICSRDCRHEMDFRVISRRTSLLCRECTLLVLALSVATKEATDEDSNELHKIPFIEITIAIRNTAEL